MSDFCSLYSKKVTDHFRHPRNMGEIRNPDGVGTSGSPICGDVLRLFIKIEKKGKENFIKEAKFQTLGCGAAIATSSILTTMIKGKSLKEVEKINNKEITKTLGGLPPAKLHCSVLASQALEKAIENYLSK